MISSSVARSTPAPLVAEVVRQVDQHPPPLHAVPRHVLEAEMVREGAVRPSVAPGIGLGTDQVDAGAVAVVVDGLLDAVAVGVELGTDVGEGVPLRRVLQRQRDDVVGPHVDVLGVRPSPPSRSCGRCRRWPAHPSCPRSGRPPAGTGAG